MLAIVDRYFVFKFGMKVNNVLNLLSVVIAIVILPVMPRNSHLVSLGFDFVIRTMLLGLFLVCILKVKFRNGFLEKKVISLMLFI